MPGSRLSTARSYLESVSNYCVTSTAREDGSLRSRSSRVYGVTKCKSVYAQRLFPEATEICEDARGYRASASNWFRLEI